MKDERKRRARIDDHDHSKPPEDVRSEAPMTGSSSELGDKRNPFRVRIRSSEVLRHLGELSGWKSDIGSARRKVLVFCRPFHLFFFYQEQMKARLKDMESDSNIPQKSSALDELRCYVEFVEQDIIPLWARYDRLSLATPKKVSHDDIQFLFRPGELVFAPSLKDALTGYHQCAYQNVFRAYYTAPVDFWYHWKEGSDNWKFPTGNYTFWQVYCLDHDGEGFRASWKILVFEFFLGEKEITSLECFPLIFHPRYEQIRKQHIERGKAFKELAQDGISRRYYSGWNLVTGLFAAEKDVPIDEPEHMESEVIIDIREAERHIPDWVNREVPEIRTACGFGVDESEISCRLWDRAPSIHNESRGLFVSEPNVELIREFETYLQAARAFNENNPFIQKEGQVASRWNDEDFALLPRRICGYVLRERKFARLDVQSFQSKTDNVKVSLDDIQIKQEHKKIIRSSVSSHFMRNNQRKEDESLVLSPDIIKGKGRGLVILLHGAPGVGKTATAEAVALEFNKPLFPITCGDLGIAPDEVEKNLKNIFRYAHLWDCVLLLDEADVFLTQRDRTNVERNALVSVFLRVLEYYSGILFLTTNRVGALDEAFRSRVHISLYYPRLGKHDTIEILNKNLNRLPKIESQPNDASTVRKTHILVMQSEIQKFFEGACDAYSQDHKTECGPWNGRQIRNAVQIAACMALFDNKDSHEGVPAVLTAEHFRTVHATMSEFDEYMTKAQRVDDSKMAHMSGDRYDGYGQDGGAQEAVEYDDYGGFNSGLRVPSRRPVARGASLRGPPVQEQASRQKPSRPRGNYGRSVTASPYAARRGQALNRSPLAYGERHMEEQDSVPRGNSYGRRVGATGQGSGARVPIRSARHVEKEEALADQYPEDVEHLEGWADDYQLQLTEDPIVDDVLIT